MYIYIVLNEISPIDVINDRNIADKLSAMLSF